jgi:hypothetical protein
MTYLVQSVAAITDIPTNLVAFAVARGWSSGGAGNIVNPVTGQSYTIFVTGLHTISISAAGTGIVASLRVPYLLGAYPGSPVVSLPSQMHQFGNNAAYVAPDSEPYIACVIECGYNQYRHMYIGSIVKAGDFTNGDVFSTNNFVEQTTSSAELNISYLDKRNRFLFGAYTTNAKAGGGARITHADNAVTWRDFVVSTTFSGNGDVGPLLDGTDVFGGNRDGCNDGFVYRGHADYGAAQILTPINLYCSKADLDANYRIVPLGHVSGARLVDMKNLSPGQQVLIGADTWRVFPEFTKSTSPTFSHSANAFWTAETSYNFGIAYRE